MVPRAKIAKRLTSFSGKKQHWVYTIAGFSSGTWAVRSVDDYSDLAKYREYNVMFGYEISQKESYKCNFELGYVFGRKMEFDKETQSTYKPDNSLLLQVKFEF